MAEERLDALMIGACSSDVSDNLDLGKLAMLGHCWEQAELRYDLCCHLLFLKTMLHTFHTLHLCFFT